MDFVTYMLKCADGTMYVGSTNDLEKRIHAHNYLKSGARYTKQRRPVRLVHSEIFKTFSEAKKREYAIKQLTRKEKLALISSRTAS